VSASIASTRSYVWYAVASSAARAICPLLANRVRPTITPRASVTPIRREQAGERGDEDDAFRAVDRACERLNIPGVVDDSEVVAQPLDQRAGNCHRALERVDRVRVTELPCNGGDQAVLGHDRLVPEREEQEGSGAVRVLHVTVVEAGVAEQ
jgi:hypothetical protein